jgi:hypothetical protein
MTQTTTNLPQSVKDAVLAGEAARITMKPIDVNGLAYMMTVYLDGTTDLRARISRPDLIRSLRDVSDEMEAKNPPHTEASCHLRLTVPQLQQLARYLQSPSSRAELHTDQEFVDAAALVYDLADQVDAAERANRGHGR